MAAAETATHDTAQSGPEQYVIGERARLPGEDHKWRKYDEKYLFQPSSLFTGKYASGWLLGLRDYPSGRTAELDRLFDHIEKQSVDLPNALGWMLQRASNEEVSKQLCALFGLSVERPL